MESFYGGPKGRDFDIKEIFTSKYQMDRDLSKGWTSSIFPGDLVVVSYGLPGDTNYDIYKNEDLQNYGKSYNSTLWQKCYNDKDGSGSAGGLYHKMIASMTQKSWMQMKIQTWFGIIPIQIDFGLLFSYHRVRISSQERLLFWIVMNFQKRLQTRPI